MLGKQERVKNSKFNRIGLRNCIETLVIKVVPRDPNAFIGGEKCKKFEQHFFGSAHLVY